MSKLAVLSDIHGNSVALKAVLADLEIQGGADQLLLLGDLVVFGPDPVGVLNLLREHEPIHYVCGNTDRYLVEGKYPTKLDRNWESQVLASFYWAVQRLNQDNLYFLASLPPYKLFPLDQAHTILAVHGSPRSDEENIRPDTLDADLRSMLSLDLAYNLLLCAHTHIPLDRVVDGWRVVNTGSVGLPFNGDPRASYVLIDLEPGGGYRVEFRQVVYDIEAVVCQLINACHPAASVQIYNLRQARPMAQKLIYTEAMRQSHALNPAN